MLSATKLYSLSVSEFYSLSVTELVEVPPQQITSSAKITFFYPILFLFAEDR